jgi:hypothetical protein
MAPPGHWLPGPGMGREHPDHLDQQRDCWRQPCLIIRLIIHTI